LPWDGSHEWQRVMADTVHRWTQLAGAADRIPANVDEHLAAEQNRTVLASAGFTVIGEFEFPTPHAWTVETLTGFVYATSFLSQPALGANVPAFARDLRARLLAVQPEGVFPEEISFSYMLARKQ
jgi:hypothetical protein